MLDTVLCHFLRNFSFDKIVPFLRGLVCEADYIVDRNHYNLQAFENYLWTVVLVCKSE